MEEKWVQLKGYKFEYQLSNYGRIRHYVEGDYGGEYKYLNPKKRKSGMFCVLVKKNGSRKELLIARLVIHYFKKPYCKGIMVYYKDANIENCFEKNLYFGLRSGLIDLDVIEIRKSNMTITGLAKKYGLDRKTIREIKTKKVWKNAGRRSNPKIIDTNEYEVKTNNDTVASLNINPLDLLRKEGSIYVMG